tara:strand:+ start:454 stop:945 length:492 start_codon:yes stop_codon:yes gene_type:complete
MTWPRDDEFDHIWPHDDEFDNVTDDTRQLPASAWQQRRAKPLLVGRTSLRLPDVMRLCHKGMVAMWHAETHGCSTEATKHMLQVSQILHDSKGVGDCPIRYIQAQLCLHQQRCNKKKGCRICRRMQTILLVARSILEDFDPEVLFHRFTDRANHRMHMQSLTD